MKNKEKHYERRIKITNDETLTEFSRTYSIDCLMLRKFENVTGYIILKKASRHARRSGKLSGLSSIIRGIGRLDLTRALSYGG